MTDPKPGRELFQRGESVCRRADAEEFRTSFGTKLKPGDMAIVTVEESPEGFFQVEVHGHRQTTHESFWERAALAAVGVRG